VKCALYHLLVLAAVVTLTGCGETKPTPPANDPESVNKLKELQKQGNQGEKRQ
jgi:predicted small lipoprotein YifL